MLAPDVDAFLRRSQVAQIASLSPKGRPFTTPLWFVVENGDLYFATGAGSRIGKNVQANPRVVMLFHAELEHAPARVLRLRGDATLHHGFPSWSVLVRIALKYYLPPKALLTEIRHRHQWPLRQRYYAQAKGGAGYLRVVPTAAEFLETSFEF